MAEHELMDDQATLDRLAQAHVVSEQNIGSGHA
jgi:hypothetical protein